MCQTNRESISRVPRPKAFKRSQNATRPTQNRLRKHTDSPPYMLQKISRCAFEALFDRFITWQLYEKAFAINHRCITASSPELILFDESFILFFSVHEQCANVIVVLRWPVGPATSAREWVGQEIKQVPKPSKTEGVNISRTLN